VNGIDVREDGGTCPRPFRRVEARSTTRPKTAASFDARSTTAALEANKLLAPEGDGGKRDKSMRRAARITPDMQREWLQKYGVRAWDKNHKKAVMRLLNSNEYRYLRIGHFII
jgi:hypothetical protein